MEDQEHSHCESPDLSPRKRARTINLQKCDFCRDRKVKVRDLYKSLFTATNPFDTPLGAGALLKDL